MSMDDGFKRQMLIRNARLALSDTKLIRLDEKLGQQVPVDFSSEARLAAAAYNLLAEAHAAMRANA